MRGSETLSQIVPIALAVTLAAPLVAPANLNPAVSLVVGALVAAALGALALSRGRDRLRTSSMVAVGSVVALGAWLTVSALRAGNPEVSFMGTLAQHTGAAIYLVAGAWALSASRLGSRRSLRTICGVVAVSGGLFGVMGVVEAATTGARGWGAAAGPFENSSSLGAFLAVSLFAAAAWWFATRSTAARVTAVSCALSAVSGLAATESRAGVTGVLVGLIVISALRLPMGLRTDRRVLAIAFPGTAIVFTTGLVAAAAGKLPSALTALVTSIGTDRDAIWRSAAAQFAQAPVFGSGPEQFSAWVTWSFVGGMLRYNGTYDPHNVLMGIALGGGILGLALWAFAAGATVWAQAGVLERTGKPRALLPVVAAPAALISVALFAWLTPAAVIAAAAMTGALLAVDRHPGDGATAADPEVGEREPSATLPVPSVRHVLTLLTGSVVVACALITIEGLRMLPVEWSYTRLAADAPATAYAALYAEWPDPSYAASALGRELDASSGGAVPGSGARALRAELAIPVGHAAYHVDLAMSEIFVAQDALVAGEDAWERFEQAIETGVRADPASGIWYTIGAAQANAEGRTAERDEYARAALELDPGAAERAYLESLGTSP